MSLTTLNNIFVDMFVKFFIQKTYYVLCSIIPLRVNIVPSVLSKSVLQHIPILEWSKILPLCTVCGKNFGRNFNVLHSERQGNGRFIELFVGLRVRFLTERSFSMISVGVKRVAAETVY